MDDKPNYKDYYYILGIPPEASIQDIQQAYSQLYDKYGPHVNIGGEDPEAHIKAYRDITEAFAVLNDPVKRRQYDETNLPHLQKSHLRALWGKLTGTEAKPDLSGQKVDALATRIPIEVTLREAYKGTRKLIRIDESLPCQECIGLKPVNRLSCQGCRGTGYTQHARDEEIELPPGLFDGMDIPRQGKGKYDLRAGRCGDLVLEVKLRDHTYFKLAGRDVTCSVPVTVFEAVLGGDIEVPTPTGKVIMKIQPLTQTGRMYRLKGLGLAGSDMLITIEVTIPQQLSAEEAELFRHLKELSSTPNPREAVFQKLANTP